ncbi:MAG: hypothetical protein IJ730_06580, partial [Alphaproteobacteria bacterium]|nr:hypothetical protein [Alphaproteobacteria bacterium]
DVYLTSYRKCAVKVPCDFQFELSNNLEVSAMKTFCFKLYKSERNHKLHKQINAAGLIYNHCIALHKCYYQIFKKYLKKNKLQKHIVRLKKLPKFNYLLEIGSQAVQEITDRIDKAFQLFFRNVNRKIRSSQ